MVFDLVTGNITQTMTTFTGPEDFHRPSCNVSAHAELVMKPSSSNYFELSGSGSSGSDPPFAEVIYMLDGTPSGEITYSECEFDFDEGTESWGGLFYGEILVGYSPDEFTFTGSQGLEEGEGEETWSFTGTP